MNKKRNSKESYCWQTLFYTNRRGGSCVRPREDTRSSPTWWNNLVINL